MDTLYRRYSLGIGIIFYQLYNYLKQIFGAITDK